MNSFEITKIDVRNGEKEFYSEDGRYMVLMNVNDLIVFDFESQPIARYLYNSRGKFQTSTSNIAFFEDYVVVEEIVTSSYCYFDLILEQAQSSYWPFPKIDWYNFDHPSLNTWRDLPAKVAKLFDTDFVYFHNDGIRRFSIPINDFQLIDVSNRPKLLFEYNYKIPSPFTITYKFEYNYPNINRIITYNKVRGKQSSLMIRDLVKTMFTIIWQFSVQVFFIYQYDIRRISMMFRTKILRNFQFNYIHQMLGLKLHYIVLETNQTLGFNMMTAQPVILSNKVGNKKVVLKGKYMFIKESITSDSLMSQLTVTKFQ